jgi:hypothetical protein
MPRWLVAFILSIVLSCYGFAALAQNLASVSHHHGDSAQTQQLDSESVPCDALAVDSVDSGDDDDKAAPHGDAGTDHSEAVDVGYRASGPRLLWTPRPESDGTPVLSPFLERPKRPPRGIALSA